MYHCTCLNFKICSSGFLFFRGEDFRISIEGILSRCTCDGSDSNTTTSLRVDLKQHLRLKSDCKIVARNPNRVNMHLDKKLRLSNHHGNESYDRILESIANEHTARLFAQFHTPPTSRMKGDIISEIKKGPSRVSVLFPTSALGMGVVAPYVTNVIHITQPRSLKAYM